MKERVYVVAGTAQQANDWAREVDRKPNEWAYVHSAYVLYGIARGFKFVRVGTYRDRADIQEIEDTIRLRGGVPS